MEYFIRIDYEKIFIRLSSISYGASENEKLKYDTWGRLIERSKNGIVSKFKYDHFGRLVEKLEGETLTRYAYDNFGKRLSRITTKGGEILDEYNTYDNFGRLVKTQSNGKTVEYIYNKKNQLSKQIIDGNSVKFEYTRLGQLAGKTLLDKDGKSLSELKYFYSKSGKITSRLANGKLQEYKYDAKNQLLAVIDMESKSAVEEYVYDASGNILKKTVNGKTTTYTYDAANQLLSSTNPEGDITSYAYDAAGRLVKEGEKTYEYGWLDKVMRVAEDGKELARFEYHNNNQLAKVVRENGIETFEWDGLALIERNGTKYINEPHAGGGNPILAIVGDGQKTEAIFTDILGTSMGKVSGNGYSAIDKTSFGADTSDKSSFFTGKPYVEGLGYAFLFRNYRADMGKWQVRDLSGYPNGWNNLLYANNAPIYTYDRYGLFWDDVTGFAGAVTDSVTNNVVTNTVADYWEAISSTYSDYSNDPTWFNDTAEYCFGRSGDDIDRSGINNYLSDSSPFFNFIEDYIPNMHQTAEIHDAWVEALQNLGYTNNPTSPETMLPAYLLALYLNLRETGKSIMDEIGDFITYLAE